MIFIFCIVFFRLERKTNLNSIKKYMKIKIFVVLQRDMIPSSVYADLESVCNIVI